MSTLFSDQRFHHAYHPYQSTSQTSRSSLPCRVHLLSPITKSKTVRPQASPLARKHWQHNASAASTPSLGTSNESPASSVVPTSLPDLWNESQPPRSHPSLSTPPAPKRPNSTSNVSLPTKGLPQPGQHGYSPVEAFLAPQSRSKTSESLFSSNPTSFSSHLVSNNTQHSRDFVRYLKAWRPPVEYYARRRYQHPSLSYPSRRPSLPSLLEERITNDGNMDIVCPELAMSTSPRAHRRRIFPAHNSYTNPVIQHRSTQGWEDDSEEDLDSDDDEDDELDDQSDSDSEAITPSSSPASSTTYFLQPLVLTKLPGY